MGCNAASQCAPVSAPKWATAQVVGQCDNTIIHQCGAKWAAPGVTLNSGSTTGTITFDPATTNFSKFKIEAIQFSVAIADPTNAGGMDAVATLATMTRVDFQDTNFLLSTNQLPLDMVSAEYGKALRLPLEMESNEQSLTIDIALRTGIVIGTSALLVTAIAYGWAKRGGGGYSRPMVP